MSSTFLVRKRPRIALWLHGLFRAKSLASTHPKPDRKALARDLAKLPAHLRRDIGL